MAAHFVVVRFLPSALAEEFVNVGVLTFDTDHVYGRFLKDWSRAEQFAGSSEALNCVREFQAWVEGRTSKEPLTPALLRTLTQEWQGSLQLTEPRGSLENAAQLLEQVAPTFLGVKRVNNMNDDAKRYTLCLAKPDTAPYSLEEIKALFRTSFDVVSTAPKHLSTKVVASFYAEHVGKPFYPAHEAFMSSGFTLALLLRLRVEGDAVATLRTLLGATDPSKAEKGTLRQIYGTSLPCNGFHGSDSVEAVRREVRFFWTDADLLDLNADVLLTGPEKQASL